MTDKLRLLTLKHLPELEEVRITGMSHDLLVQLCSGKLTMTDQLRGHVRASLFFLHQKGYVTRQREDEDAQWVYTPTQLVLDWYNQG